MQLLLIHILLFYFFIMATAFEGVFMIPVISFLGIPLALIDSEYSYIFKSVVIVFASISVLIFIIGVKYRATWQGKLINIAGFYLWFICGFFVFQKHLWMGS